jgi:hypothetical protein
VKTTEEVRDAALYDLSQREDDEPCRALHGMAVIDSLGFDPEQARGAFVKLRGRPCGKVREFAEYAKQHRQEQRQHLLTMFARRVPVVAE